MSLPWTISLPGPFSNLSPGAVYLASSLFLLILYRILTSHIGERSFKAFAKQNNCLPPLNLSEPWYLRPILLLRVLRANKTGQDVLDDIIGPKFQRAATYSATAIDGSPILTTTDPANIQAMLATRFEDFDTGELRYKQLSPLLGRSIFTSDGAFWAHSRALFRPQFARDNINDLASTEKAMEMLFKAIGEGGGEGWTGEVKMMPLLWNFTLDTATDFLFGESVGAQEAGIKAKGGAEEGSGGGQGEQCE
jgi:cytochrome P450